MSYYDEDAWEMADDLLANFLDGRTNKTNALVGLEFDPYREVLIMTYDKKYVHVDTEYGYNAEYWTCADEGDLEQDLENLKGYLSQNGIDLVVEKEDIERALDDALKDEHNKKRYDEPSTNPQFYVKCNVMSKEYHESRRFNEKWVPYTESNCASR